MELRGRKSQSPTWNFQGPRQGQRFLTKACYRAGVWQDQGRDSCQQPLSSSSLNGRTWCPGCGPAPLLAGCKGKASESFPPTTVALLTKSACCILDVVPQQCSGLRGFIFMRLGLSLRASKISREAPGGTGPSMCGRGAPTMRAAMPFAPSLPPVPRNRLWWADSIYSLGKKGPVISFRGLSQGTGGAWRPREPPPHTGPVTWWKPLLHPEAAGRAAPGPTSQPELSLKKKKKSSFESW